MKNAANRLEKLERINLKKDECLVVHIDRNIGLTDDEFCMATFGNNDLKEVEEQREHDESESDFLDRVSDAAKKMAVSRGQNIAAICLYRRMASFINNKQNFKRN